MLVFLVVARENTWLLVVLVVNVVAGATISLLNGSDVQPFL